MGAMAASDMDTVLTDTDTPDSDTMARGLLRPSPRPRQRLMPLFCTELTDTPMVSVPTAMALSAMLATPMFMALESPPPTMSSDTPLPAGGVTHSSNVGVCTNYL